MKTIKIVQTTLWVLAIGLILVASIMIYSKPSTALGDSTSPNFIKKMSVSSGISVSTTSVTLLPANSGRVYAVFVNDGTVPVYLSLDGNAAVANSGIRLNASGGSYEISPLNLDIGLVTAITASGTAVVTVTASQ